MPDDPNTNQVEQIMPHRRNHKRRMKRDIEELNGLLGSDYFDYDKPKPLAIGIRDALIEAVPQWSRTRIRTFLGRYARRAAYRRSVAEADSKRYLLDGSIACEVEESHRVAAREALEQLAEKREADKKAQTEAASKPKGASRKPEGKAPEQPKRRTLTVKSGPADRSGKPTQTTKVVYKRRRVIKIDKPETSSGE